MRKSKTKPVETVSQVNIKGSWTELSGLNETRRRYCSTLLRLSMLEEAFAGKAEFEAQELPQLERSFPLPDKKRK